MIARLSGTLIEQQPPIVVIDCHGVGYEVECPMTVFGSLPAIGEPCKLVIHTVVREDAHLLFGFAAAADRQLFRTLLKISGVGPKLALAILSSVSAADFALMVESGDSKALTKLPGIGKKTAERLVLEMKSRLDVLGLEATGLGGTDSATPDVASEARAGLIALGYSATEALKMVKGVDGEPASAGALIRQALKNRMAK